MIFQQVNEDTLSIKFSDLINLETHQKVVFYYHVCLTYEHLLSVVPGYHTLMIQYDIRETTAEVIINRLNSEVFKATANKPRVVVVPVCYETFGLDLEHVASSNNLSIEEVINIHTQNLYPVYMLGFTPGFPYLGNLDKRLITPRLTTPRTIVPKGSVGIGGEQTGIYPLQSPGGWQIIGRTPLELFDVSKNSTLFVMGDVIRFKAITRDMYTAIEKCIQSGTYEVEVEV